jgi:signal transduction histidine kinase
LSGLELIRKRVPPDPKITMLLDNVVQATERGAILTKRMLAFARRQELKTENIHIPELVHGMGDMLQRSLGQSASIETHFPLRLSPVSADANQLEMALLNLAVNARDAMPEGGRIIIAAHEQALSPGNFNGMKPGRYVRLSVTDTGAGMDEETLKRATEPFFTTKGVGKGTGLGLPMVHGLAEQFGGRSKRSLATLAQSSFSSVVVALCVCLSASSGDQGIVSSQRLVYNLRFRTFGVA